MCVYVLASVLNGMRVSARSQWEAHCSGHNNQATAGRTYANRDHNDDAGDGDEDHGDCETLAEAEEEFTSEQYLKEMERILRKIKRREVRKVTFSKHLPGEKYFPFSVQFLNNIPNLTVLPVSLIKSAG